jgi:hypothetical protein
MTELETIVITAKYLDVVVKPKLSGSRRLVLRSPECLMTVCEHEAILLKKVVIGVEHVAEYRILREEARVE